MQRRTWLDLARIGRRQLGLFTAGQARRCGISYERLRRLEAGGRIERWHRGVYAIAGAPDSYPRRLLAAQLACGPVALVSHASAASLHRLCDVRRPDRVHLLVPRRRERSVEGAVVHSTLWLPDRHRRRVGPIPVTSVERTICDLAGDARSIPGAHLRTVVHDAWRRGASDPERIAACLDGLGRVRGASRLRRILAQRHPQLARARSVPEAEAFHRLQQAGVPLPEMNWELRRADGSVWCVLDLAWPVWSYAVEIDSRAYHAIAPDVARDRDKDADLIRLGWLVDRFRVARLQRAPDEFVALVRARLRGRGCPLSAEGALPVT
jgi:hypothetical protein